MTIRSYYVRSMLLNYDKQLVTARRLAKYRRRMTTTDAGDEIRISREAKRRELVERVAKEIIENLIIAGTENPVVADIKKRLEQQAGQPLQFKYPPMELSADLDIQIYKETSSGPVELNAQEKTEVLRNLYQITLDKVNDTML